MNDAECPENNEKSDFYFSSYGHFCIQNVKFSMNFHDGHFCIQNMLIFRWIFMFLNYLDFGIKNENGSFSGGGEGVGSALSKTWSVRLVDSLEYAKIYNLPSHTFSQFPILFSFSDVDLPKRITLGSWFFWQLIYIWV